MTNIFDIIPLKYMMLLCFEIIVTSDSFYLFIQSYELTLKMNKIMEI